MEDLAPFGWDCERPLFEVRAEHVKHVLELFLQDETGSTNVELWADAIELRDDLTFSSDPVREAVHVLANPVLEGPLDSSLAKALLARLPGAAA